MSERPETAGEVADARVRVFVADDHPLFREALAEMVRRRADLHLVGEAADGRQALRALVDVRPDVAVLDVRMPGLDGNQVIRELRREGVATAVLLISAEINSAEVYRALGAGARGYLSKHTGAEAIAEAIRTVAGGGVALGEDAQMGLAGEIRLRAEPEFAVLSVREREVLQAMSEGMSAPETGRRLLISTSTVKTHQAHIYEKLGVSERAAAVAAAMRRGMLS